eukprot:jgi/Chrpa1/10521/Chrysochromulina_OHIO_Genome00020610-RA
MSAAACSRSLSSRAAICRLRCAWIPIAPFRRSTARRFASARWLRDSILASSSAASRAPSASSTASAASNLIDWS